MDKQISIRLGGINDSIAKQLRNQHVNYDPKEVERFQKISDAITLLAIYSYISPTQSAKARNKLHQQIIKHCNTLQQ